MASAPHVLFIELDPDHPLHSASTQAVVTSNINISQTQNLSMASSYAFTAHLVGPQDTRSSSSVVEILREKKWDVIIIGPGIRKNGSPEMAIFFEGLVNAIATWAAQAKMGFSDGPEPEETIDAVRRSGHCNNLA